MLHLNRFQSCQRAWPLTHGVEDLVDDGAHGEALGGAQVDDLAPVASLRRHPAHVGATSVGRQVGVPLQGEDQVRTAVVLLSLPASIDLSGMQRTSDYT